MKFSSQIAVFVVFFLCNFSYAGVLVQFKMGPRIGTLDVELFEKDRPITVSNFLAYVKAGHWRDTIMHRWVNFTDTDIKVLQGGDQHVPHDPTFSTPWSVATPSIDPFPKIPFEGNLPPERKNVAGTIAMARVGDDLDSGGSNWFFNLINNPRLDAASSPYAVFGKVVRGASVIELFAGNGAGKIWLEGFGSERPVYWAGTEVDPVYWINVEITVLTAEIVRLSRGFEIAWNSVQGRPNIVEYTTVIPPVWNTLRTVDGTGERLTVIDGLSGGPMRQYRIRIDYSN